LAKPTLARDGGVPASGNVQNDAPILVALGDDVLVIGEESGPGDAHRGDAGVLRELCVVTDAHGDPVGVVHANRSPGRAAGQG
jgi:hypothetical protein